MKNFDFENIIISNLKKFASMNEQVAVALSGGSDSLSLILALHNSNINVLAIMVDHNLREKAKSEIEQTIKTLNKFKIKYVLKEWDGNVKNNVENEARKARYSLLFEVCKENNIKILCIGHHLDDQIETFLLNLARGSGLDGLCAMPNIIKKNGIDIIRPMLNLTKKDCENYLKLLKVEWVEDESNKDTKYKRNKIRFLLEQIEDRILLEKRIETSIKTLQEVKETIDKMIAEVEEKIIEYNNNNDEENVKINTKQFVKLTKYVQKTILVRCILKISKKEYKTRLYQIENILYKINQYVLNNKSFRTTLSGCIIETKKDTIIVKKEKYITNNTIFKK